MPSLKPTKDVRELTYWQTYFPWQLSPTLIFDKGEIGKINVFHIWKMRVDFDF